MLKRVDITRDCSHMLLIEQRLELWKGFSRIVADFRQSIGYTIRPRGIVGILSKAITLVDVILRLLDFQETGVNMHRNRGQRKRIII
jgi:hypothetical protein